MRVQPYLFFEGRCEEALEFYRRALGAEVEMLMRFKDSPDPGSCTAGTEDKVMHASFRIGDSTLMASDGRCQGQPSFQGIALSLTAADDAQAERLFAALAEGGQVQVPLEKTFFSSALNRGQQHEARPRCRLAAASFVLRTIARDALDGRSSSADRERQSGR
jgi:PhnB protein